MRVRLLLSGNRSIIVRNTAYYYQDIYTRLRVSVYIPAEGDAFFLPPYSVLYSVHQLVDPCHVCLTSFLDECSVFLCHVLGKQFHHLVFIFEILSHPRN